MITTLMISIAAATALLVAAAPVPARLARAPAAVR
jgi:hypothetical protein